MKVVIMLQPVFDHESVASADAKFGAFETRLAAPLYEGALSEPSFEVVDDMGDHLCARVWIEIDHAQVTTLVDKLSGEWDDKNGIWNVFVSLQSENGWDKQQREQAEKLCRPLATDTIVDQASEQDARIEFVCYKPHELAAVTAIIQTMLV